MAGKCLAIVAMLALVVAGCAAAVPHWRDEARTIVAQARSDGAEKLLPAEYGSVAEALVRGETLLVADEVEEADAFFHLAWTKGMFLRENIAAERKRLREEEAKRAEAERLERERQRAREEEERQRAIEEAARKAQEEAAAAAAAKKREGKVRPPEQRPLAYYHTVKRGETLPQIAAQAEVYGDMALWPLIYRANRDQISDPRRIWPGQVLRIPRSLSRDEIIEARRFARERPVY